QEKKFDTFIDFISKYFTVALISIAIVACIFWLIGGDSSKAWGAFTAVLIIACPCALALSSPFTLSAALSIFDRNKFYIKNTAAIEQLSAIDCVVFDKTGTISSPKSSLMLFEGELDEDERSLVSSVCRNSNHPLSREIVKWIGHTVIQTADVFKEITGKGMEALFDTTEVKIGSASFLGIKNEYQDGSVVYIMINELVKGYFTLEQSWRQGLSEVVGTLNKGEYDLHLISGDNERRSDALKLIFPSNARLLFNQSPSDKLHKINFWQDRGKQVCMLGDGLND